MSKKKKILIFLLTFLIILSISIAGSLYYIKTTFAKVEQVPIKQEELAINKEVEEKFGDIKNIALFGVDAPDGKAGRSDAIMILTLDSEHNKMKVTSIMRDSYVNIDGHGMDKINHAYAFGGPELAIKTLNENFDLNIKDFVAVNFTSLPEIIDKIGGIEVELTSEEVPHVPGTHVGMNVLNGNQALAYSRIRYATGGDYKRTERQRIVLDKVFNKLKSTPISQYPSLINTFLPFVKTNMSASEMLGLTKDFSSVLSSGLQQERFPKDGQGTGQMINGVYYLTFNNDAVKSSIHNYIFEDVNK
ncbi:LCP family protein [Clostridium tarantellae]|uniref:LytR family transcriptional regulator n=1 Tax=Clostridium tarantellae TaxID=39493 RepID=A0A6I1MJJ5_9CLOT|nr:LCP family protein [Clostridium tarantellae]MPQ43555.1 LytR family transcriptional regulator [Clostridium tarantellae]